MYKVSDFKIPYLILKLAAELNNKSFVDINIKFDPYSDPKLEDGVLILGKRESLQDTFWGIVSNYLNCFEEIYSCQPWKNQEQKISSLSEINKFFIKLFQPDKQELTGLEDPVVQRLYQNILIWNILETIICPSFDIKLENKQIILYRSPFIDIADSFDKDDFDSINNDLSYPFIFLNDYCMYEPIKCVHLLLASIKSLGECPFKIINDLYQNKYLFSLLEGVAKNYFLNDEELNDFINYLLICVDINVIKIDKVIHKTAQMLDPSALQGNWWYFGLYEKMLEPSRGKDDTIHNALEDLRNEIQKKIDYFRKKKGREGLTYEKLLRIKDHEVTSDNYKTLEKLISSDRIW